MGSGEGAALDPGAGCVWVGGALLQSRCQHTMQGDGPHQSEGAPELHGAHGGRCAWGLGRNTVRGSDWGAGGAREQEGGWACHLPIPV